MYNWIDGRKFSDSRYLPALSFVSRNCVSFIKSPFEVNTVRRLPVIKEEDGYVSEEELPQNPLSGSLMNKKKYVCPDDSKSNFELEESIKASKLATKLPSLNVNCMMNPQIKQTQSIWDTKFGKRLISGKNNEEDSKTAPTGNKKVRPNSEKVGDFQESKTILKRKTLRTRSTKISERDKVDFTETNNTKKKSKNTNKAKHKSKKIPLQDKELVKKNHSNIGAIKAENVPENSSRELLESCPNSSSISKNQRFLTRCVQSILDGHLTDISCDHCNESFQNVEDLCKHKKQHETEKETCLLCEKVFYSPNEFIQHLLTHEGVDRFSCKKCKKYFPSLRKYKQHCLDYHFTPPDIIDYQSQSSVEYVKKWLPKFECKRCKLEFDSEEKKEAHRRNHVKKDLTGAYLLSQ